MKSVGRLLPAGLAAFFLLSMPFEAHALSSPFLSASEMTTLKFDDNIKYQQNVFTRDVRRVTPTVKAPAQTENSRAVVTAPITTVVPVAATTPTPPAQTPTTPVTPGNNNPPPVPPVPTRSIRTFGAACDGITDDRDHLAAGIDAAKNNAFTLIIDCPVFMHVGMDIAKPIFFDSGVTVTFTSVLNDPANTGKLIVDNVMEPAFVISHTSNITLTDWNIEYVGTTPITPAAGGYYNNGAFVANAGNFPVQSAFNDVTLKTWQRTHRGIVFDGSHGWVSALWAGPTNDCAIFQLTGDASNLRITGMNAHVPQNALVSQYIPMLFSSTPGWKSNTTVSGVTQQDGTTAAVPANITFDNITLDGYYMGWQGQHKNTTWNHIRAYRYGDLQDNAGGNIGGNLAGVAEPNNKWFAPPHLYYLNYNNINGNQQALANQNIVLTDIVDAGPRLGLARDIPGHPVSGNIVSIKVGGFNTLVDGYTSNRPDGFLYVLPGDGIVLKNMSGTYDSAFLNNMALGFGFQQSTAGYVYKNVTLQNISLTDSAAVTSFKPINGNIYYPNENISGSITVTLNQWTGGGAAPPQPAFTGTNIHFNAIYNILH